MSFPNMAEAFFDWDMGVQFKVVNPVVADFEVTDTPIADVVFRGVVQPIPATKLMVKPEGQRQWKWFTLWTVQRLALDSNLKDDCGNEYRVMRDNNWQAAGYQEYEVTQGPTE